MHELDWIEDMLKMLDQDPFLTDLKKKRVHGSLQLNFCDGEICNYDLKIHRVYVVKKPNR